MISWSFRWQAFSFPWQVFSSPPSLLHVAGPLEVILDHLESLFPALRALVARFLALAVCDLRSLGALLESALTTSLVVIVVSGAHLGTFVKLFLLLQCTLLRSL